MAKMKIGIFIDSYFPLIDGVIMVVDNYAKELSKFADVIVVAPDVNDDNYIDNFPYKIIRVKSIKIPTTTYYLAAPKIDFKTRQEILNEHFDIIHIHSPFSIGKLGIEIGKKEKIPVIATIHTQFKIEFKRYTKSTAATNLMLKTIMKTYNSCYECWAVNNKIKDIFKSYGYKKEAFVQNNATEMLPVKDKKKCDNIVNKMYNLEEEENILLFVGRINVIKNIFFIVDTLKELKQKNYKFKMLFVGDGPDFEELKHKIKNKNLSNEVVLCGEIKDRNMLANIFSRANLFVFPSMFDASSLVQIEAACQKTPTIFLRNSATSNTITDNINGFVSDNNPKEFANKIITILEDKKLYEKVSNAAYRDLYKSWKKIARDVYRRYQIIIKNYNKQKQKNS